jgi:RimJ/RimL family protein N-acetyltransferase
MPQIALPADAVGDALLQLRAVTEADVPAFVEAFQDPAIAQGAYHGKMPATDEALRPYLRRNAERMQSGEGVLLAIWEAGAERLSGQTMLFDVDWDNRSAELGFWIAPWARGRGLSVPALRLTLRFAFDHVGMGRVVGLTGVENVLAQRAMERAGLEREGVLRGFERTPTGRMDQVCFACLCDDPRPG